MSLFSQYRHLYKEPERMANDHASRLQRRVESELEKNLRLQESWGRLSPESQKANFAHLDLIRDAVERTRRVLDERDSLFNKARVLRDEITREHERELRSIKSTRGFASAAISGILQRQRRETAAAQESVNPNLTKKARRYSQASAADRRFFYPGPQDSRNARSVYGTEAISGEDILALGRRHFVNKVIANPCIQRSTRQQVLFARGHAPGAHRGPKKRNPFSQIWC